MPCHDFHLFRITYFSLGLTGSERFESSWRYAAARRVNASREEATPSVMATPSSFFIFFKPSFSLFLHSERGSDFYCSAPASISILNLLTQANKVTLQDLNTGKKRVKKREIQFLLALCATSPGLLSLISAWKLTLCLFEAKIENQLLSINKTIHVWS